MESYTFATAGPTHPVSSGGARNFQLGWGLSPDTWRARGARAYTGIWRQSPSGVQGQSTWGGSGGLAPLKLKAVAFGRPSDETNLHQFRNFAQSQNHIA